MTEQQALDQPVVFRGLTPCPYLSGRLARLPLRRPTRLLSPAEFQASLEQGDRRSGRYLYRPACPRCSACEPVRVSVAEFVPRRTQRRIWKRGNGLFRVEVGEPKVDRRRIELFNEHRDSRHLAAGGGQVDAFGYREFLVDSCCDSFELRYFVADQLMAVAVMDEASDSLSAVYTYYADAVALLSPGVFSILRQIEECRIRRKRYLYLGYYIAQSKHMSYKAEYLPHERLVDGSWRRFEKGPV